MTDSSDIEITNAERAVRCHAALEIYDDAWDARTNAIDMLTDLRHWCDRHGLAFHELDRTAYQHYMAEFAAEHGRHT